MQGFEAALYGTGPQRGPGPYRRGDALEFPCAEVLQLEKRTEKLSCVVGDHHSVRFCNPLKACCKVWSLADNATLLRFTRSDQVADNNQPGRDAYASL